MSIPQTIGPLSDASNPTTFCLSAPTGGAVAVGWDLLRLQGGSPAVVKQVALTSAASGLAIAGAVVVPVLSEQLVGNGWSWPLSPREVGELAPGVSWNQRRDAAGATVSPSSQPQVNLVVGLSPTSAAGGSGGIVVDYSVGSAQFQLTAAASVTVKVPPDHC